MGRPSTIVGAFNDRVGATYQLISMTCLVDGVPVYKGGAPGGGMFDLPVAPGDHAVTVTAEYGGKGSGLFSYMDGYRFKVKVGRVFPVRANEKAQVTVTAFERGGATAKYEDRLALAVDVR